MAWRSAATENGSRQRMARVWTFGRSVKEKRSKSWRATKTLLWQWPLPETAAFWHPVIWMELSSCGKRIHGIKSALGRHGRAKLRLLYRLVETGLFLRQ